MRWEGKGDGVQERDGTVECSMRERPWVSVYGTGSLDGASDRKFQGLGCSIEVFNRGVLSHHHHHHINAYARVGGFDPTTPARIQKLREVRDS